MCQNSGFTLIELLVVTLIIGILSAVAVPQYQRAVDRARFANASALVGTVRSAQNAYYMANGTYSPSWEGLDISFGKLRSGGDYVDVSKNVYCYIGGLKNEYGGCSYSISEGCRALHLTYWGNASDLCYASVGCERANQVCKSATGKTSGYVLGLDNVYRF